MRLTGLSAQCCFELCGQRLELGLVAQVRGARRRAGREGGEVVQRLVVELEQLVRAVRVDRAWRRRRGPGTAGHGRARARCRSSSPGAPTSPSAFDQPPEYQAQSTPFALRRSPIVGAVCGGSLRASRGAGRVGLVGRLDRVDRVVAAGHAGRRGRTGRGRLHDAVSAPSRARRQRRVVERAGLYERCSCRLVVGIPLASTTECRSLAPPSLTAPGQIGVAAATSHWWLRNEPPNAAWKKSSAIA